MSRHEDRFPQVIAADLAADAQGYFVYLYWDDGVTTERRLAARAGSSRSALYQAATVAREYGLTLQTVTLAGPNGPEEKSCG